MKRHALPILPPLLTLFALLACSQVQASGGGSYDRFVNRSGTDIALNRYQAGTLGIVLPSYERTYLYSAWRSVALGPDLPAAPNPAGALLAALGSRSAGWMDADSVNKSYDPWQQQVSQIIKPVRSSAPEERRFYFLNCPAASYQFATATLKTLVSRSDATPARLNAWIAAQQQVFNTCGDDPEAQRQPYASTRPQPVAMPAELPESEPLYWRQLQQYQLAAAAFYAEDYQRSLRLFTQIGATAGHPMRQWGAYLALRSQLRGALAGNPAQTTAQSPAAQQKVATLEADAENILRDPTLAALHESTRALIRSAKARITPEARLAELSAWLADPRANPYQEDHLGDWRVLADQPLLQPLRKQHDFIDWIVTIQSCNAARDTGSCKPQLMHAVEQWHRASKAGAANGDAQARTWLLAAAMLSDISADAPMPAAIEHAASAVTASAPEYLTLRHALTRHFRLNQQDAKARNTADAVLASTALADAASAGARNQFLQERFAVATSASDAAPYLLRAISRDLDPDTGEIARRGSDSDATSASEEAPIPAADGLRWLNQGLANADLYALASDTRLPANVRTQIAIAAWMRADLLQQDALATQAAQLAGRTAVALAPLMADYLAQTNAADRRHRMLLLALKYGYSPVVDVWERVTTGQQRASDDMLADLWCKIPGTDHSWETAIEQSPPLRDTGNSMVRHQEVAALGKLKTATGYLGDYVLQRAARVPADPDLPWLLHVVVVSTKGGCLDDDVHLLSKTAFTLLHKRYKNSPWAARTPYFY